MSRFAIILAILLGLAISIDRSWPISGAWNAVVGDSGSDCRIKGNISYNTGEKIYHLPSDSWYSATRINRRKGERWFCSEEEARAAGWRRAYR